MSEVTVPPYPSMIATAERVYKLLDQLREWTLDEIEDLREVVPEEQAAKLEENRPEDLPEKSVWDATSVADKYVTLQAMRQVREGWDHLLREYEDAWDCHAALKSRYRMSLMAVTILRQAFIDPETREAKQEEFQKWQEKVQRQMRNIHLPPHMRDEEGPLDRQEDEGEFGYGRDPHRDDEGDEEDDLWDI